MDKEERPIDHHMKLEIDVHVHVDPIIVQHQHQCYNAVRLTITFPPGEGSMPLVGNPVPGATGTAKLVPVPDGAVFVGTPSISSDNPSLISVSDNGDGTASVAISSTANPGDIATVTGIDNGNGFSDPVAITVAAPAPPAETGVALTVTFP